MAPSITEKSTAVLDTFNDHANRVQGDDGRRFDYPPWPSSSSTSYNSSYHSSTKFGSGSSREDQILNSRTNAGSLGHGRALESTFESDQHLGRGYFSETSTTSTMNTHTNSTEEHSVVIRGEEIGIVVLVLLLWVGAIILFFNRWGKIRMLEPYQPKFCENHRLSCPMADVSGLPHGPRTYSKFNLSAEAASPHFAKCNYHGIGAGLGGSGMGLGGAIGGIGGLGLGTSGVATSILSAAAANRPRQNSVFVSSPHSAVAVCGSPLKNTSRKTKSALDLSTLILSEGFLENVRRNSKNSITHL